MDLVQVKDKYHLEHIQKLNYMGTEISIHQLGKSLRSQRRVSLHSMKHMRPMNPKVEASHQRVDSLVSNLTTKEMLTNLQCSLTRSVRNISEIMPQSLT